MRVKRDVVAPVENLVLAGALFTCTGPCGQTKPASAFGFRVMGDGKTRNQPQCISCRSLASVISRAGRRSK